MDLLVERLNDRDMSQRVKALDSIRDEIEGATKTMTSVPKPLKFLSPHYEKMKEYLENQSDAQLKVGSHSNLSVARLIKLSAVSLTKF